MTSYPPGEHPIEAENQAVDGSPDNEGPSRSVPKPTDEHREHEISIGFASALTISSQWNVEVIAEPGRKGDVPAVPEVGGVLGEVRTAEVRHETNAEPSRDAAGNKGIAREIAVDLEGEGVDPGKSIGAADLFERREEDAIGDKGEVVGEGDFQKQSDEDE